MTLLADLYIIGMGGELNAATEGNGGGRGGKEASTVHLVFRCYYMFDTLKNAPWPGGQMLLNVRHLFLALLLLQLPTPVPRLIVGLLLLLLQTDAA